MKIFILLSVLVAQAVAGQARRAIWNDGDGDGYWNRGFGVSQAVETHSVTLRVANIDAMISKVDALMSANGGASHGAGNTYTNNYNGSNLRYRQMSYMFPLKVVERAAKKTFDLGELVSYNLNRSQNDARKEVDERVKQLKTELDDNKAALEKMPAAKYFLTSKFEQLKKVQESYETSATRGMLSITLQENAASQKP